MNKIQSKYAIPLILLTLCGLLFAVSRNFSFGNVYIDRLLKHIQLPMLWLAILLILIKNFREASSKLLRNLKYTGISLVSILFVLEVFFSVVLVSESSNDSRNIMYFHEKESYRYFVKTRRRSAIDDLDLVVYKEKEIFEFLKVRRGVEIDELKKESIDLLKLQSEYEKMYFRNSLKISN